MSDEADPALDQAENEFKLIVWNALVDAGLDYLKINVWPINAIITFFTNTLWEFFSKEFDVTAIVFLNAEHKSAFDKAISTLRVVASDKGINSPEYQDARDNARETFQKFIQYNATI